MMHKAWYVSARESQRAETYHVHYRAETLRAEKIGALSDPVPVWLRHNEQLEETEITVIIIIVS